MPDEKAKLMNGMHRGVLRKVYAQKGIPVIRRKASCSRREEVTPHRNGWTGLTKSQQINEGEIKSKARRLRIIATDVRWLSADCIVLGDGRNCEI